MHADKNIPDIRHWAEWPEAPEADFDTKTMNNGGCIITRYRGSGGVVRLPAVIRGEQVTEIGLEAFESCSDLSHIVIPEGTTYIGLYAFSDCDNLTGVVIPDSVHSIGWHAFQGCSSLKRIDIPDSVTDIGGSAFEGCSSLTSVTISPDLLCRCRSAFPDSPDIHFTLR